VPDKSPLVSIGMPLYNEERYLRQTLESLISQDYANFELIISDNRSVDGTSNICQEYAAKDQRVHYYRNEINIGAAGNFQRVFELAQGDYFVWVAGHDLWHRTFLSRCLEILSQDASIVLCYPQALWINTDGQPLGLIPSSVETRGLDRISRLNVVLWGLGYCYPVYGLISSQALRKVSLGLQVIATDAIILAELSLLGAFAHITEPLLYMRKMDDFGSWDKYVEKIFLQSLSDLSPPCLYWQMIDEHLKIVSKHIGPSLEKDAATLSTVLCLLTKYSWVLNGIQYPKGQLESSKSDVEERINQLGSQIHDVARSLEKQFIDDKLDANQKVFPKILIDGVFFQLYRTGIARVWNSLLEKWSENSFGSHIIVLDRAGTASKIAGIRYLTIPAYNYETTDADREMLQQVCDEEGADLFISTFYTTPLSTPSVFMAYDMVPEVMEWDLNRSLWQNKHHAIRSACSLIAISENTANDLVRFFTEISRDSVKVAYCGVDPIFQPANPQEIEDFKDKYKISKPYFLVVGLRSGYKNAMLFFQSFAKLENKESFAIVCVGGGEKLEDEFVPYVSEKNIYLLPHIEDNDLRLAYTAAVALVYPSKYEGLGLPILEAMACGCPVITCPVASIPEVAGEAVLYVNHDVDEMAIALSDIQNQDVRQSLIATGFEQARKFSWSQMAKTVSSVLIEATLLTLKLRKTNLIVFPDWYQSEEVISRELEKIIMTILTHPESQEITLLIDTSNLEEKSEIDANLVVSGVVMNLLMQEDLEMAGEPEISLVGKLSELQWQALLPRIQARISLENENQQAIADTKAEILPLFASSID
jgi:glycosyltransferase involved in cell wall biosynthesis